MKYERLQFLKSDKTELFKSRNDKHYSKASISVDKNECGYPNSVSSLYQTVKNLKYI